MTAVDIEQVMTAMNQAARDARAEAARYGLKIPVWKNGKIVYLDPIKDFPEDQQEKQAEE